jgi:hypothetical protein
MVPHNAVTTPCPTTDIDFIDLRFDAKGGPHWNHATDGDGDGAGGEIQEGSL